MKQKMSVKKIALIGMLGALAGVLMTYIRFPLPFMPPFMDFDFSAIPEMIGGFVLGPASAMMIIVVKILIKLALNGTSTMFTGELSNLIVSAAYVIPAVLIYRKNRTKNGAIIGMSVGLVLNVIVATLSNLYLILPFYINLMGFTQEGIIGMVNGINPLVTDMTTFVVLGVVPFNVIKYGVASIVTAFLYKRVSPVMKRFME